MTKKATTYGSMILAVVLLVGVAFVGAASAGTIYINSVDDWNTHLTDKEVTDDVVLGANIVLDFGGANCCINSLSKSFEGNGSAISNFSISGSDNTGLIGYYSGSRIANLTISNFTVSGSSSNVGGLVGYASSESSIENVHAEFGNVTGNVNEGEDRVGGLVGIAHSAINLINCTAENCVVASSCRNLVGGLVGIAYSTSFFDECTVKNCSLSGRNNVGGLVGRAKSASSSPFMRACTVTNCIVSVGSGDSVGGLVGCAEYACEDGIENCRVENCTIVGGNQYVGGLVGIAEKESCNFNAGGNWLNMSAIRGTGVSVASVVGWNSSKKSEYWDLYPLVQTFGSIWLHNTSNVMDLPQVIIAKSDVVAEQGPENSDYFNTMGGNTYFGEPTEVNADIVTRLTGYGYQGKYSALAYVYPPAPKYAITNTPYSNVTVLAYNATTPAGTIDRAEEGALVHLVAENPGYHFVSWNVTNSTGVLITPIIDGNFTMPAESVNVDAISYANVTAVKYYDEGSATVNQTTDYTFGTSATLRTLPTKSGYTAYWNVSETGADLDSYVTNGNWAYPGDDAGELNVYVNWTQNSASHKSPGQTGYTIILTETPTPIATQMPADVPTIKPTVKPTTTTSASPAPLVGLISGLGIAGLVMRLRK